MNDSTVIYAYIRWLVTGIAGFLVTQAAGAIAWFRHLEGRVARNATQIHAHEESCEVRQKSIQGTLDELKAHLERQDDRSESHRGAMAAALGSIGSDIAVLKSREIINTRRGRQ